LRIAYFITKLLVLFLFFALTHCASTKYHLVTENAFYAESSSARVSVHCTPEDPEEKNSFTYLFLDGPKRIDELIFRRPWSYETCLWRKEKILKILTNNKIVTIAGMSGQRWDAPDYSTPDDQGVTFTNPNNKPHFTWIFERIDSDATCEGYFSESCEGTPVERLNKILVLE
jgi:hypothetical protein